jgi:hypothetical protein
VIYASIRDENLYCRKKSMLAGLSEMPVKQNSMGAAMTLPKLQYNFHDARVASILVGPRSEITLLVDLDDPDHPPLQGVYVRFGGITNFSEVVSFIERVPRPKIPDAYWTTIEALEYDTQEHSKHHSLVFRLALDAVGQVRIRCRNIATTSGELESRSQGLT